MPEIFYAYFGFAVCNPGVHLIGSKLFCCYGPCCQFPKFLTLKIPEGLSGLAYFFFFFLYVNRRRMFYFAEVRHAGDSHYQDRETISTSHTK